MQNDQFTFEYSLTILNHLGRNLYRSFVTVIGEAISNSWDADAKNVWIYIDRENSTFVVKDDGIGMDSDDFQNKFLKIGYSKRKGDHTKSPSGRPYIGRKGIGKLALLSCADRISILTRRQGGNYVGSVISNSELDQAIEEDRPTQELTLGTPKTEEFDSYTRDHDRGTIIKFDTVRGNISNTIEHIKKIVALYFRFSLIDDSFKIHINDEEITLEELSSLIDDTEFMWIINRFDDPYIRELSSRGIDIVNVNMPNTQVRGFIASVEKPSKLTIRGMNEKVSVDLFVNGRLRQKDIVEPVSWNRLAENYLYGQIHYDELDTDSEIDRFTSNREGIISNDDMFSTFLAVFKKQLLNIYSQWDELRLEKDKPGDSEEKRISIQERKSRELSNVIFEEYNEFFRDWTQEKVKQLKKYSTLNVQSYLHCFLAENILREYTREKRLPISSRIRKRSRRFRTKEKANKVSANLSIEIRKPGDDLDYLDLRDLVNVCETPDSPNKPLADSETKYKPIRDAVMHTAVMTNDAYKMLDAMYTNIKGGIRELFDSEKDND